MTKSAVITNNITETIKGAASDIGNEANNEAKAILRKYPSVVKKTDYGHGLFTTASLPAKTIVEKFVGPDIQYENLSDYDKCYVLNYCSGDVWKWLKPETDARYANHSCDPNSFINDNLELVTRIPLGAGEEITFVYNNGEESDYWDPAMDFIAITKRLKQQKQGQVSKLLLKSEAEIELLETIREYMSKRSEIEGNYCKQLEKLSKGTAGRQFRKVFGDLPPLPLADPNGPSKIAYNAFSTLLGESEKHARSRGHMSEILADSIVKAIKEFNKEKGIISKKLIEFGFSYQQEFIEAYEELNKAKQKYDTLAKETASSKEKYEKMLNKPKTTLGALKVLVTGKDVEERKKKWKSNSRKLTDARNDYILSLSAINAMQNSYYENDLPNLIKNLDGEYYPTITNILTKFVNLEDSFGDGLQYSINLMNSKIPEITRERDLNDFLKDYETIFDRPSQFSFELNSVDDSKEVVVDDVTKVVLGHKLGAMVVQEEDILSQLSVKEKELEALKRMAGVFTETPSFGDAGLTARQEKELISEVDHFRFKLSRILPRIKILRDLKVEPIMPELPGSNAPGSKRAQELTKVAVALYSYTAQNDEELNVTEGDELEVLQEDENGWTRVKNGASGVSGIVPTDYLKITTSLPVKQISHLANIPPSLTSPQYVIAVYDYDASDEGEVSYKSGDQIEVIEADQAEEWWEGRVTRTGETGSFQILFTQGWESVQTKNLKPSGGIKRGNSKSPNIAGTFECKAKALYDYIPVGKDEIALMENEIIIVISKNTGSPDWWEGENSAHKRGQFPANYVEEISVESKSLPRSITSRDKSPNFSTAKALYDYVATVDDELSIKEGDIIKLLDVSDSDWWKGELNGQTGTFPANYVEKV